MRKKIFEIIEVDQCCSRLSFSYDIFMIVCIIMSIIPLAFKNHYIVFDYIDSFTVFIFILDYILRFATADYKFEKCNIFSFVRYPFSPMAIIDLISIIPSISSLNNGLRLFKIFRLFRSLRVFKVFKVFRYSKSIALFINVFKKQRDALTTVAIMAISYIAISALIVLNIEPDSFHSYFDALYWATVSLTTVGYGDIYPVTTAGRVITMFSSLVGIAIVAMPSGIITAGIMDEISKTK